MSKNNYDQFNLPPTGPNLCDFYGQYIGFGGGGPTGVQLTSIAKSALFDSANDEDLSRGSMSGTATTWTASFWVCRGDNGQLGSATAKMMFTTASDAGLSFGNNSTADVLAWYSGSYTATTRLFRDTAWYHMVVKNVGGVGTVYVNGQPVLDGLTVPTADATMAIGSYNNASSYLDGYMAEWVFIDGTAHQPTTFAEYDPTGTFWVPKSPTVIKALTFGSNGFYLDNATNAQTDAGSEGNNFTNNNTVVTVANHTPTSLQPVFNPLFRNAGTFVDGNRKLTYTGGSFDNQPLTLSIPSSGKWYHEFVCITNTNNSEFGICDIDNVQLGVEGNAANTSSDCYVYEDDGNKVNAGSSESYGNAASYTDGDVIGIAYDADNNAIWFSKNDSWIDGNGTDNSATVKAEIEAGTTSSSAYTSISTKPKFFVASVASTGVATTRFESDYTGGIPTGFSALNTTNIASAITRTKSDLSEYFESIVYEGNGLGQTVGRHLPFTNAFTIGKSALFDRNNSESLSKTFGSAGSSTTDATINVWIKQGSSIENRGPLIYVDGSGSDFQLEINIDGNDHKLRVDLSYSSANHVKLSSQPFLDQSDWAMVTCILDTTNGTASERIRLYWNSVRLTLATDNTIAQNQAIILGSAVEHQIGALETSYYYDGYMAQFVFTDGQILEPTNFGLVDAATGRWVPKDVSGLTFGNNGFFLDFATSTLGNDVSGNNNDFANNNTVVQTNDSPTTNFGTLLNNLNAAEVLTNGNRSARGVSGQSYFCLPSGLRMTTEKIFVACRMDDGADGSSQVNVSFGCHPPNANIDSGVGPVTDSFAGIDRQGGDFRVYNNQYDDALIGGTRENHTISAADTDVITMAVDPSDPHNGKVWFGVYDTSEDSHQYIPNAVGGTAGDPALGTLPTIDGINFKGPTNPLGEWRIFTGGYRHTAATTVLLDSADIPITIPSGFLEFKQSNIKKGRTIATGASADEITPSYTTAWNWIKNRDATDQHMLFDRVRGPLKDIHADGMKGQVLDDNTMYQFLRGGVRVMNDVQVNTQKESYVSWQWYMEATGTGSSNTDGSINTTSTLVDTNLGMSISEYVGTGSAATVGHGLGVVPEYIIIKNITNTGDTQWLVYSAAVGNTHAMFLDATTAIADSDGYFNDTTPTSTVFSVGNSTYSNESSESHIAYSFAPSQFTAIGSYVGNGNADGTFIPTTNSLGIPITPSWFMAKSTGSGQDWRIVDDSRSRFNVNSLHLRANTTAADVSETNLDIDTGGIKIRTSSGGWNTNGTKYIYLAFGTPIIDTSGRIITGR